MNSSNNLTIEEKIGIIMTDLLVGRLSTLEARDKLISLKAKWETEAYKKGYIDGGINQLTNGDK